MKKIAIMIIAVLLVTLLAPCAGCKKEVAPVLEGSLRLMTFNTKFLTSSILSEVGITPDTEAEFGLETEERAQLIADQILALEPSPDIIALLEVFDEDARDVFYQSLKVTYTYVVDKLDVDCGDILPDVVPEDSGLMLFSRFPFTNLPNTQYNYCGNNKIAYIPFDDISYPDSLANKGVGFVRIKASPGLYVNVAFTHFEASYGDDDAGEAWERAMNRKAQLADVNKIIQGSLDATNLENELVFVMGDLNINGNPKNMDFYWGDMPISDIDDDFCGAYEWDYHFNRYLGNSVFSTYYSDSWRYDTASCTTSKWVDDPVECDPGQTTSGDFPLYIDDNPTQGERLDYILHNNNMLMASAADISAGAASTRYLVQHIRRVWEPALGTQVHSDHLAVMAEINLYAPYCNPLIAYEVGLDSNNTDATIPGTITHKESVQWYCVGGQGGSYSIKTSSNVKFDVYESKDLSRPIRVTDELTRWGMQYSIPKAPFYIRVSATDPSWTGDYTISIHLHLGKSKEDAILIDPLGFYEPNGYGYGYLYQMPTAGKINNENIVWFKIMPEISDTGDPSSMKGIVDSFFPPFDPGFPNPPYSAFSLKLMTEDDAVIAESVYADYPYDEYPQVSQAQYPDMYREELGSKVKDETYYLQVHSEYPGTQGDYFIIHWQTSLTYYIPGWLRCYEQEDNTGDDDIYYSIWLDEDPVQSLAHIGEFDDGGEDCNESGTENFATWTQYKFVGNINIELREHAEPMEAIEWTSLGYAGIYALPMNQKEGPIGSIDIYWINSDPDDECDPYWDYRLEGGRLYHMLPKQL